MPLIRGSSTIDTIDELRTIAASLIDQEQSALAGRAAGESISCRRGCTACCNQAVPVGPAELRALDAAIDALPAAQRERTRAAIAERAQRLRSLGFGADDLNHTSGDERQAVIEHYFAAGVPCPLLDGDTCIAREARPLTCRDYLVTSDPEHCATLPNENIVRVRLGRNVIDGFARAEYEAGDRGTSILALALDQPIPDSAPLEPYSTGQAVELLTQPQASNPRDS